MSSRYQIVVQGEASETDSDDEVYITSMPAPQPSTSGVKVRQGQSSEQHGLLLDQGFHWLSWLLSGSWGGV